MKNRDKVFTVRLTQEEQNNLYEIFEYFKIRTDNKSFASSFRSLLDKVYRYSLKVALGEA